MRYLGLFLLCFVFSNCGSDSSYYLFRNYEKDREQTASIGNPMIRLTLEYRNNVYGNVRASARIVRAGACYELIYSGKAGNVIKLIYREYADDMARPAFSQEVQHDLNETRVIKFKNTKFKDTSIEVLQATNQEIVYRVLYAPSFKYEQGKLSDEAAEQVRGKR